MLLDSIVYACLLNCLTPEVFLKLQQLCHGFSPRQVFFPQTAGPAFPNSLSRKKFENTVILMISRLFRANSKSVAQTQYRAHTRRHQFDQFSTFMLVLNKHEFLASTQVFLSRCALVIQVHAPYMQYSTCSLHVHLICTYMYEMYIFLRLYVGVVVDKIS